MVRVNYNLPKLGSKASVDSFRGAIAMDNEHGSGIFVAELKKMYMGEHPKPANVLEHIKRQNLIHQVVTLAMDQT